MTGTCGRCRGQDAWRPASFEHDRSFVLDGDHNASCATCHRDHDFAGDTCYDCHAHSRSAIRAGQVVEGIYDYEHCVECHRNGEDQDGEDHHRRGARTRDRDTDQEGRGGQAPGGDEDGDGDEGDDD